MKLEDILDRDGVLYYHELLKHCECYDGHSRLKMRTQTLDILGYTCAYSEHCIFKERNGSQFKCTIQQYIR